MTGGKVLVKFSSPMLGVSFWLRVKVNLSFVMVMFCWFQVLFSSWRRWTGKASMSSLLRMMPFFSEI